jgi:hypothetical protein
MRTSGPFSWALTMMRGMMEAAIKQKSDARIIFVKRI